MQNLLNLDTQSLQLGAMRLKVEEGEVTVQRHCWKMHVSFQSSGSTSHSPDQVGRFVARC